MSDEAETAAEAAPEQTQNDTTAPAEATPVVASVEAPAGQGAEEAHVDGQGESVAPREDGGPEPAAAEAAEPAPSAEVVLPPALVSRAVRAGMEDDEILGNDSPAALERACALLERRASKGEAGAVQRQQPAAPPEFKLDLRDPATGQDIGEEQLDPVMMHNLKDMAQFVNSLAKAAYASVREQQSAIQAIQTQAHVEWLDGAIPGLGEQYQGILGKGTIHDLDPKGPEMQARTKLDNAMAIIANGCVARGQQVPNKKALLTQAADMAFGSQAKAQARKEVAGKLAQQASQMTMRPTQRTATPPPPLSPDEEALAAANAVLIRKGLFTPEKPSTPTRRK